MDLGHNLDALHQEEGLEAVFRAVGIAGGLDEEIEDDGRLGFQPPPGDRQGVEDLTVGEEAGGEGAAEEVDGGLGRGEVGEDDGGGGG